MTTVTLRKANDFERALLEQSKKLSFSRTLTVSIHTDKTVAELVAAAQTTLHSNLNAAVSLVRAAHSIRAAISVANQDTINGLLSQKAALDAEEKLIISIVGTAAQSDYDYTEAESAIDVAQRQLESLRARADKAERYGSVEAVTVRVLDEKANAALSETLADLRLRKRALADEVLTANMVTKITLNADTTALLKQFKLI